MANNLQLAKLWTTLDEIKKQLDNTAIPLGGHLGLDDPNLMMAMEELSERIEYHFDNFKLEATRIRKR